MRAGFFSLLFAASPAVANDLERGATQFEDYCAGCHQVGEGAVAGAGPVLTGVVGRAAAATEFDYSEALVKAGEDGLIWTPEAIDAFLSGPQDYVQGTAMAIEGVDDAADRADLISFLQTHTGAAAGFTVSPEVLALEGDPAYGEYLAGECTTCHRADGTDEGIPAIVGWETSRFATALHAYKAGARKHPVMEMIAGRLGDQEIAALAAYFETLKN